MIVVSSITMNLSRNNQNAAILKTIKISKNCHGRFTANYLQPDQYKMAAIAERDTDGENEREEGTLFCCC